jgi:hypothetical protein
MGADILPPDILIRAFDLIFERFQFFPLHSPYCYSCTNGRPRRSHNYGRRLVMTVTTVTIEDSDTGIDTGSLIDV